MRYKPISCKNERLCNLSFLQLIDNQWGFLAARKAVLSDYFQKYLFVFGTGFLYSLLQTTLSDVD